MQLICSITHQTSAASCPELQLWSLFTPSGLVLSFLTAGPYRVNMQTISEVWLYFWLRRSQWATHLASHFPSLPDCPFSHFPSPCAAFLETKQDIQINNHNRPMVPCPWAIPNSRWGESINYSTSFLPSPSSSWPASCLQSFLGLIISKIYWNTFKKSKSDSLSWT